MSRLTVNLKINSKNILNLSDINVKGGTGIYSSPVNPGNITIVVDEENVKWHRIKEYNSILAFAAKVHMRKNSCKGVKKLF